MPQSRKLLYIDAFAGLSGDMFLGAIADLGVDLRLLEGLPKRLGFEHATLTVRGVNRKGIAAKQILIEAPHEHVHRHLRDIEEILRKSDLPSLVIAGSMKTFRLLAEAEAKVHGTEPGKIHFHEVGAVDSILDIVGTHLGFHELSVGEIVCSPVPLSRGSAVMAHGMMPLPAPATVEILKGVPTRPIDVDFESVTPTGASLAVSLASGFGDWPNMTIRACGWGSGTKEGGALPNLLRLVLGEASLAFSSDRVWVLECEVDDMSPEWFEPLWTIAFEKGALDLYLTPVQMKKGRPGTLITLLTNDLHRSDCERFLLEHTTTYGVRRVLCDRTILDREVVQVETEYGVIPVKIAKGLPGKAAPEAAAVKAAAERAGVSMGAVHAAAMRALNAPGPYIPNGQR
jgi:hypothetical protein